jgi:hypothetical protein
VVIFPLIYLFGWWFVLTLLAYKAQRAVQDITILYSIAFEDIRVTG